MNDRLNREDRKWAVKWFMATGGRRFLAEPLVYQLWSPVAVPIWRSLTQAHWRRCTGAGALARVFRPQADQFLGWDAVSSFHEL